MIWIQRDSGVNVRSSDGSILTGECLRESLKGVEYSLGLHTEPSNAVLCEFCVTQNKAYGGHTLLLHLDHNAIINERDKRPQLHRQQLIVARSFTKRRHLSKVVSKLLGRWGLISLPEDGRS